MSGASSLQIAKGPYHLTPGHNPLEHTSVVEIRATPATPLLTDHLEWRLGAGGDEEESYGPFYPEGRIDYRGWTRGNRRLGYIHSVDDRYDYDIAELIG
jgi:hypothetical protein